jgi:hypothetical protein
MNTVIIKCILLCVFNMNKTDRNNILNMYSDIVKHITNQSGLINKWGWG